MEKPSLGLLAVFFCCLSINLKGQEYSFKHYGTSEGLVGNHVYDAAKDSSGFLWFATETGVSRFDGTSFKNFTTEEGLPDNEILKLFVDSKGKVWMMPFKKAVCYYYEGKIHNTNNDTILRKLNVQDHIENILEDNSGNLIFTERQNLIVLPANKGSFLYNDFSNSRDLVAAGGLKTGRPLLYTGILFSINLLLTPAL